jgi:hypothetical protein
METAAAAAAAVITHILAAGAGAAGLRWVAVLMACIWTAAQAALPSSWRQQCWTAELHWRWCPNMPRHTIGEGVRLHHAMIHGVEVAELVPCQWLMAYKEIYSC